MTAHTITYDALADILYVLFAEPRFGGAAQTESLDDYRRVDYLADGSLFGIEIESPSLGVELDGLPERAVVAEVLDRLAAEHGWATARA